MGLPQLATITHRSIASHFPAPVLSFLTFFLLSLYIKPTELGQGGPSLSTWDAGRWERPGVDWLICLCVNCCFAGWFPHVPHT